MKKNEDEILKNGFSDVLKPKSATDVPANLNEGNGPKRPLLKKVKTTAPKTWRETNKELQEISDNQKELKEALKAQLESASQSQAPSEKEDVAATYEKWFGQNLDNEVATNKSSLKIDPEYNYFLLTDNFLRKITDFESSAFISLSTKFHEVGASLNALTFAYNDHIQTTWSEYQKRGYFTKDAKQLNLYDNLQARINLVGEIDPEYSRAIKPKDKIKDELNDNGELVKRMIFDEQKNKSAVQNFQGNNIVSESFFNIDGKEVLQKDYTNGYKITISINQSQKSFESEEELIGWWLENILTDDDMLVVNRDAKLYKIVTENKKLASKILEIN